MKKIFWVIFIFICVCQSCFAQNLACEKADKKDKPFVVMYSADYCFHCKQFKPIFFHLADNLSDMYNFSYHDITKKHKPSMCDNVYLDGIPTLYVINPKTGKKYIISEQYYNKPEVLRQRLTEYYKSLK